METVEAGVEIVVVPESGKYHKRYIVEGRTVDDGRCGTDDNWERVNSLPPAANLCGFCWPKEAE